MTNAARKKGLSLMLAGLLSLGGVAFASSALAQTGLGVEGTGIQYGAYTGLTGADIRVTIANIIRVALGFLGILAVLLILYGGFVWMTAAGNEERITRAKQILTSAVIGLVIIMSAFAIVSFVLNALVSATSGDGVGVGAGPGGPGGGGFGVGGEGFRPTSIQPFGQLGKRDVVAVITFNTQPTGDVANIRSNILLEKVEPSGRVPVAYAPTVVNSTIRLVPDEPCPAPNEDRRCLEADTQYAVTIRAGLQSSTGSTVNCGFTAICSQSFRTGDAVGTSPPTVAIADPTDGQSVRAGELVRVQSLLTDEFGIGSVEYFSDGSFFAADGAVTDLGGGVYTSQTGWDTVGISPVRTVRLKARATNIDGDETDSGEVSVVVRPAHCFNGVQDADETGPDCGGADCGACVGGSCSENSDCASGQCVAGQCITTPKIVDVQLRNGAPGNIVTITGTDFGTGTGTVTFLGNVNDPADDAAAPLAQCAGSWGASRVFIVVPDGAVTGPIRLTTSAGRSDATNDTFGPVIPDFQVNDVRRPGICGLEPTSAKTGQTLVVSGQGFGDAQGASRVQFARASAECVQAQAFEEGADAGIVSPWSAVSVQPTVPNLFSGTDGANYLLRVFVGGESSNFVCLRVLPPEAGTEPRIDFVSPGSGSVGSYLTVFGANFGSSGTVRFARPGVGEAVGATDFPAQCSVGFWRNDSVTVKVPAQFTTPSGTALELGGYQVSVRRSDGRESNAVSFTVNNDPMTPGLCRVEPVSGPVGTPVALYGEGFGTVPFGDLSGLAREHPDSVLFHENRGIGSLSVWNDRTVGTVVPSGAATGPVAVRVYSGTAFRESNPVNFEVRDCRETGGTPSCGEGLQCCGDGSCRADCAAPSNTGGFAWQFSTGPIPVFPVVLEDATCQISPPTTMPSPNPFRNAVDVCTDIGAIALRFSLPMDASTFTSGSVILERCAGDASLVGPCSPVATGIPTVTSYDTENRSLLAIPVSGLEASSWHRLTITDAVRSLGAPERAAQQLDGDFDGRGGGAYVTQFKTGEAGCVISAVDVQPHRGLIDAADATLGYSAFPLSNRCIILQCTGRSVAWSSSDPSKATVSPLGGEGMCATTASPVAETAPGPDIQIAATIDGLADSGNLTIDYANPRVVSYGPRDCTIACVNAMPFAVFNTEMATSGSGSVLTNARLQECVNESCLAFAGNVPVSLDYHSGSKMLTFEHAGLRPNTFYRVVVDGSAMSTSQAPLTGLNYENRSFSWIFRTRADGNPCGPQAVAILPPQTTLRFIGEVSEVLAVPRTSPDACSETGQLLTSSSYNWSWNKSQSIPQPPETFTMLPDYPTILNTNPVLPNGCTSRCLAAGSFPPGTPACGNGRLERGEACDTPGANGCTSRCLRTGNSGPECGNGIVEPDKGEECDEGAPVQGDPTPRNGQPGSGCTAACKLTGSVPGVSVCGNGSVGVGEQCDDGNTLSGDGCSALCLLEGSDQNVPVCGNGVLEEPHEQCDYETDASGLATRLLLPSGDIVLGAGVERDPKKPGFPCSSSCLLTGNPARGSDAVGACGNGVIEPLHGEGCDAGAMNGLPGSGCSSFCTRTGEDIVLGAFCGDAVRTVKPADPGGAQHGGGEDCEAIALDANIDPRQVVKALNQCDAKNSCVGTVRAAVETASGEGRVNVECSCRVDSDCTAFGSGLACGAGACCFQRPAPPDISPKGGNECRNAAITVVFGEEMDIGSLRGNLLVEQCGAVAGAGEGGPWYARAWRAVTDFFRGLFGREASAQAACSAITGEFKHANLSAPDGAPYTHSLFVPSQVLAPNTLYRVRVLTGPGGAKTRNGVGYPALPEIVQEFSTGEEICSFDVLQVEPSTYLIQSSADRPGFRAVPMTRKGGLLRPISPVPNVYEWSWEWAVAPMDGEGGELTLFVDDPPGETAAVQAATGRNGRDQLVAAATITSDEVLSPSTAGKTVVGKAVITTFLCENPWPRRDTTTGAWSPYQDPATHFEFHYCRDGAGGILLPELMERPTQGQSAGVSGLLRFCRDTRDGSQQPKSCSTDADCGAGDACQTKDLFFLFRPEWRLTDAIGVRVAANVNHLAPRTWYDEQRFSGATEPLQVDGYNAIKDARTIYVSAADKYGDPQLRSYIYVYGYNEGADPRTVGIFDQIVANLRFNANIAGPDEVVNVCKTRVSPAESELIAKGDGSLYACSSDLDCFRDVPEAAEDVFCAAPKDKLRRDMRRWEQLHAMTEALDATRDRTGFYPRLESGSFIRGMTVSTWPSWSQLGAAALPDPLNAFNRCEDYGSECSVTRESCRVDGDCDGSVAGNACRPKFEAQTCFNNRAEIFMCPAGSRVYQYRAIGGVDYRLQAEFEYLDHPWGGSCETQSFQFSCEGRIGCYWDAASDRCRSRISIVPICSGLFSGNRCLANGNECSSDADCPAGDTCQPAGITMFGPAVPGSETCGNGVVEGAEECEIGQERFVSCATGGSAREACTTECRWQAVQACPGAAMCGNGIIEFGESCDDGAQNGEYGRCRTGSLGCEKRCVNIAKRATFTAGDIGDVCASNSQCGASQVCTDRMNFCGDGVRNGPESCDDGAENGKYGKCAWDCRGPGPRCGDLAVNGPEQCDGNQTTSSGVCVPQGDDPPDSSPIADGSAPGCVRDADCGSGFRCDLCAPNAEGLPQSRTKSCRGPAHAQACTFDAWSACKPAGACGNGVVEGSEQCDDGSANSPTGRCLPTCRLNVCNDGFLRQGVEQCDNGAQNGTPCVPKYGLTCNYCKNDCTIETVSGAFCGDGTIQSPPSGPESCDPGPVSGWCSRTYSDPADSSGVKGCRNNNDCLAGSCRNYPGGSGVEGNPCHTSDDCAALQFCQGGEGQCVPYGAQCIPAPYSNTVNPSSPSYMNGNCVTCSNSCAGNVVKSPYFCGDGIHQPHFGEQCEGVGDPDATGPSGSGTYYGCRNDCTYDTASGYCGDGQLQTNFGEQCEGTLFAGGSAPTCASLGWGVGTVACGRACGYYGGGCSGGPLSPGDVRVKVTWDNTATARDHDVHMVLPSSSSRHNVGYGSQSPYSGSAIIDPHVWWSWDDTTGTKGLDGKGLEIMTFNWRSNGSYWPSNSSDPYRFYVYNFSRAQQEFSSVRVTVCTYKAGVYLNEDCSTTFTGGALIDEQDGSWYWYVFDAYGSNQDKPTIVPADRYGKCTCSSGACTREQFRSCFNLPAPGLTPIFDGGTMFTF